MSELVESKTLDRKIGNFVHQSAIFSPHTKIPRDVEIGATAVHKSHSGLAFRSRYGGLVSWIEDQHSASA